METNSFVRNAKFLTQNPLGIIALFIALIYSLAALLFGTTAKHLTTGERQPLIWFIVLFPQMILGVFYKLVAEHHPKLYSPNDYKSDESFLKAITPEQYSKKVEEEVDVITFARQDDTNLGKTSLNSVGTTETDKKGDQKQHTAESREKIKTNYLLAEKLALQKLQTVMKHKIDMNVYIANDNNAFFDGVIIDKEKDQITFIEIKYLKYRSFSPSDIREFFLRVAYAEKLLVQQYFRNNIKMLLVLVSDLEEKKIEPLKKSLMRIGRENHYEMEIQYYNFESLKNENTK